MVIIEIIYNTGYDLTVFLSGRDSAEGNPSNDGYSAVEVESGKYQFELSESLVGEFDIWALDSMGYLVYRSYILLDIVEGIYRPNPFPMFDGKKKVDREFGCKLSPLGFFYDSEIEIPSVISVISPEKTKLDLCSDSRQQPGYMLTADTKAGLLWDVRDSRGEIVNVLPPCVLYVELQSADAVIGLDDWLWFDDIVAEASLDGEFDSLEVSAVVSGRWNWDSTKSFNKQIDLSNYPNRFALFRNPFCSNKSFKSKLQIRDGQLLIIPPEEIMRNPGIYHLEVVWVQDNKQHYGISLVSVEQSLFNRAYAGGGDGPLTLDRIRMRIRDFPELNDSAEYEFSIKELIVAILDPLEYYNETPPYSDAFTASNFPYRQRWLDAVVSRLLHMQAQGLFRNQVQIQAEGLMADSKAKYHRMLQLAEMLWKEYQQFVVADKSRKSAFYGYRRF